MVKRVLAGMICVIVTQSVAHADWEYRGNLAIQMQQFFDDSVHEATQSSNASLSGEVEAYRSIGDSGSVTITPFARLDQNDDERTHVDFRELLYTHVADTWELRAGLGKVFWGVAESVNPVDIINQVDAVENDNASAKLGQPMVNLLWLHDWADIDFYLLPGFRERTFPSIEGRPRLPFDVDINDPLYESSAKEQHVDVAIRASTYIDVWDLGFHIFRGTSRDPLLVAGNNEGEVRPFYYQQTQIGIDAQATLDSWLLKAEWVQRNGNLIENHQALVAGFEYSFFDIKSSGADLGIVAEWLYDERGDRATQPFQNDVFAGVRIALNNEQSLEGLVGAIVDLDGGGQIVSLEASRRLGQSFKLSVLGRFWQSTDNDPTLSAFEKEDHLQLDLAYFF